MTRPTTPGHIDKYDFAARLGCCDHPFFSLRKTGQIPPPERIELRIGGKPRSLWRVETAARLASELLQAELARQPRGSWKRKSVEG
jgi:hypothetical protein